MTAPKLTKAEKAKIRIQLLGKGASHCTVYKKAEKAVVDVLCRNLKKKKVKKKVVVEKEKGERKLW